MTKKIFGYLLIIVILVSFMTIGGCTKESVQESEIPENYTTFTDEQGLFSISYPPDWEPGLSLLPELEQYTKELISSMNSDLPVDKASVLFFAGIPVEGGYRPNFNISVEPIPATVLTHDQIVEGEITGIKQLVSEYHEFSRNKTTVGGREATIIEWEATVPQAGKFHYLVMFICVGRNAWAVTCGTLSGEYDKWEEDFQAIVRSLRILK